MKELKLVAAVVISVMLALFVCYEADTYIHPRPSHAASQFANIICDGFTPVSITADTQIITAGNANMFVYICSYNLNAAGADIASIVEGTGATCGTNTKAMIGGSTGAGGLAFAASTTVNFGGGAGAVAKTTVAGNNVCILRTTGAILAGVVGWTQMAQ
jgi:hypothetical protein